MKLIQHLAMKKLYLRKEKKIEVDNFQKIRIIIEGYKKIKILKMKNLMIMKIIRKKMKNNRR